MELTLKFLYAFTIITGLLLSFCNEDRAKTAGRIILTIFLMIPLAFFCIAEIRNESHILLPFKLFALICSYLIIQPFKKQEQINKGFQKFGCAGSFLLILLFIAIQILLIVFLIMAFRVG